MIALAGYPLGLRFRHLSPHPNVPAAPLSEEVIGEYDDPASLDRFADGIDVATYEFENVPVEAARRLARSVPVFPPPVALEVAQDRLAEKRFFRDLGIGTAAFQPVDSPEQLRDAVRHIGLPAVLKTRRWGYDGKGQHLLHAEADLDSAWTELGGAPLILEGFVHFRRELSILAVRGRDGDTAFYPLVENHHRDGILRLSLAPAPGLDPTLQREGEAIARAALDRLDYAGVLAIELFDTEQGLLANEMAPRVHNSGHWSIEGAPCSQFENHLRAILGLPLGATHAYGRVAMLNLLGDVPPLRSLLAIPEAAIHLYEKQPRPGRKLGHVTLRSHDDAGRAERLRELERVLKP